MQMYKILGADGKEYGPITAHVLQQWIAEGRIAAATSAQVEGGSDWKPLSTLPEFAEALAGSQAPPVLGGSTPANPPSCGPAKTSGLAIASVLFGVFGFLCLPALAGLVLGIIALIKISQSKGQLRGQGLAIAGICLSGIMLILVPVGAGLLLPALARAKAKSQQVHSPIHNPSVAIGDLSRDKAKAQRIQCVSNLKQICLAARIYASDNKDTLPPDFLSMSNYLSAPKILVCPADTEHTKVPTWAEFDPRHNLTYEYLKPGITESMDSMKEVIFRCPIHNNVGMGDGSVQQRKER
jgi:hypothetical protein